MKTVYLKAPFVKSLKLGQSKYIVQLPQNYQKDELITIACARSKLTVKVVSSTNYAIGTVPWIVLDNLNLRSRQALKGLLESELKVPNIEEITVLEVIVQ